MTRVLHVIGSLDRGGAESVLLDLVRADPSVRHVVLCWSGREGLLAPEFRAAGASVVTAPVSGEVGRLRALRAQVRAMRPDAVVSHVSLASAFVLAVVPRSVTARIARMHSAGDGRDDGVARRAYRAAGRVLLPFAATHVLAVSDASLDFALGGARRLHRATRTVTSRLGNGVDTDRFLPRGEKGDDDRTPRVIHVGRAAPEKHRGALVPIFRELRERRRVRMDVVGTLDVHDLGRLPDDADFSVIGQRSDVEVVLADADVLVLPSRREGLPGVVLEALSCAVPVVVSDLDTLRELGAVLEGIELVDVDAPPSAWADALERQLAMPWDARLRLREVVRASPFALHRTVDEWRALWPS